MLGQAEGTLVAASPTLRAGRSRASACLRPEQELQSFSLAPRMAIETSIQSLKTRLTSLDMLCASLCLIAGDCRQNWSQAVARDAYRSEGLSVSLVGV